MPWRPSRRAPRLRSPKKLGIVATLVAVLVVSLVSAAFAGVFSSATAAAAGHPVRAPRLAAPHMPRPHAGAAHSGRDARRTLAASATPERTAARSQPAARARTAVD